jgi:hypothetical protein
MPQIRYLELRDHVGVDGDGNHEPLAEIGLALPLPTMRDGEVVQIPVPTKIRPAASLGALPARIVPDTRIVEIADRLIAAQLLSTGKYEEIPAPTSAQLRKAHEKTAAHRQARARSPTSAQADKTNQED